MAGTLTWLGHASFRIGTPGGKRVYVDPWLENPKCPPAEKDPARVDLIALTHGHADHVGETVELARRFGCPVVALVELRAWLVKQGLPEDMSQAPNKGGTVEIEGIRITLTDANHSSSSPDGEYLGEPAGLVIALEDGTPLYFAGDTNVFGDMQLIGRIYRPQVAVLPIGDHFTMGPREAAVALELLGAPRCVPCHWGTFPILTGTPQALRELAPAGVEILDLEPGGYLCVVASAGWERASGGCRRSRSRESSSCRRTRSSSAAWRTWPRCGRPTTKGGRWSCRPRRPTGCGRLSLALRCPASSCPRGGAISWSSTSLP